MENAKQWENQKFKAISIDNFLVKLDNSNINELEGLQDVYALLNYEQDKKKSLWNKLFGSKKKKKNKIASLSSSSSYEIKDERFDSVVVIRAGSGMGSGFFISNDEILTNYHVIENAMTISIIDRNKKRSSAVVVKKDLKRDLALLKTNMKGKPVKFYSGQLKQGEMVEALGHPKNKKFSLTKGWISAIRKESSTYNVSGNKNVLFIQTDAAINPGNSGGPLFYKDKVIGVNTQGLGKDVSEGMNFAVHFFEVQKFLSE
jgi:Trypsin-like serine proteases, typically periplasmic, contain C-terminal PDZ domain